PETGDLQSFVLQTWVPPGSAMPVRLITVNVTADTKYLAGIRPGTSAQVKVGRAVTVLLKDFAEGAGTAVQVQIMPPKPPTKP
ncbi:MAG: hypothetical protein WCP21_19270, partial [Armatimonadota bacterium]